MKLPIFFKTTLLLLLFLSFSCFNNGQVCAAEKLVLQLPWHHQFQFAGYYMAKELGYYQDAGLDVEIRDVNQGANTVEAVISGQADFGISGSGLLVERSHGKPVVAVATIFQQDPSIFLTLKQANIRQLTHFIGKKVMLSPGFNSLSLIALLNQEQVLDKVDRIPTSFDPNSLLNGQADVFNAYRTNEPYQLESLGYPVTIINPEDYGIYFYGDTLFTSEIFLTTHPKTLEKFRQASIKGWEYALGHVDEAITVILSQYQVTKPLKHLQFEAAAIEKIIQPDQVEIGTMNLSRWAQITHHLIAIGAVSPSFHMESNFLYEPPHGVHWDRLWPWVVGTLVAFVLLFVFVAVLSKSNIHLRKMRTRLQVSEARNESILRSAPIGIGQVTSRTFNYVNENYAQMLGYSVQELVGNNSRMTYPSDEEFERVGKYKYEEIKKKGTGSIETVLQKKDGTLIDVFMSSTPVNQDDLSQGVTFSALDITDRKQAEAQRLELEIQLRQKFKMEAVGTMAGGIAHNFNNNLSVILGNVELSQLKNNNPEVSELLKNAKIGVMRSRDLVNQIMSYSHKGAQSLAPLQLPLIIDETLKLLSSTIPTTVQLNQTISPDSYQTTINADASQIQEILLNLYGNAVHAMEEKGTLDINLDVVDLTNKNIPYPDQHQPGRYARITIRDTGCGMTAEVKEKIFDPFFTTKEMYEGTGMGLSTVQGIIKQHNGLIKVESSVGQGTAFELYFPVIDHPQTAQSTPVKADIPRGAEKILFVDDDEMLAKLWKLTLTELGYQVSMMTESPEALKLFAANADYFDLVITDQTMPDLCGKDLIQELLKIRPDIPTIICTGFSSKVNEEEAAKLGAKAFVMKPLDLQELAQTVRRVLDEGKEQ